MKNLPTHRYFDLAQQRSHLLDWGGQTNAPTILFLHGLNLTSNAEVWSLVIKQLNLQYRVLALDLRSHGKTHAPNNGDFSFNGICEDIEEIRRQLNISQLILVGHSWGCDVAMHYAAIYPTTSGALVLLDGGFVGLNKVMNWADVRSMQNPLIDGESEQDLLSRVQYWLGECYNEELLKLIYAGIRIEGDATIKPHLSVENFYVIAKEQWQIDAEKLYSLINCPVLLLPCIPKQPHDEFNQQFLAWKRIALAMAQENMTHASIEWLSDCIHDVHLQKPQLIADKIECFVGTL